MPPPDAFLSYFGPERPLAEALVAALRVLGHDVWWDGQLADDEPFERQLQQVLAVTHSVVGLLSPSALASDWVRWELSQARENGLRVLVVLAHGARREDLPPSLQEAPVAELLDRAPERVDEAAAALAVYLSTPWRTDRAPEARRRARRRLLSAEFSRQASVIVQGRLHARWGAAIRGDQNPEPTAPWATPGFSRLLREHGASLVVTSPDAGRIFWVGSSPDGTLTVSSEFIGAATGLATAGGAVMVAAAGALTRFENILHPGADFEGRFSHCFAPRTTHYVGDVGLHDVGLDADGRVFFASTRYSCIATPSSAATFREVWHPPFISELVPEDRCHLGGLALSDAGLVAATAFAATDAFEAWRPAEGRGVLLDTATGHALCTGLSMPHSPRLHEGALWLLDSGTRRLGFLEPPGARPGRFRSIARVDGFPRGLAFLGPLVVVGVSVAREADASVDASAGVQLVELATGATVETLSLGRSVREIYDVAVLHDVAAPTSISTRRHEVWGHVTIEQGSLDSSTPQ